ncbi:MAG: DUF2147 domain-containing protein [Stellaceae bacterium]
MRRNFFLIIVFAATVAITPAVAAQDSGGVTGRWLTESGKGVIAISPCGDSICGRIDWMKTPPGGDPNYIPRDKNNPDPARRQLPMCGLQIIYGFHHDGADPKRWVEGKLYDPESGDTYHGNITVVDSNHLRLRGYIGIPLLGESQLWTRVNAQHPVCRAG